MTLGDELFKQLSGGRTDFVRQPPPAPLPMPEPITTLDEARDYLQELSKGGMSQRRIADKTGVPRASIGDWLANRTTPSKKSQANLTKIMGEMNAALVRGRQTTNTQAREKWLKSFPADPFFHGHVRFTAKREDGSARHVDLKPSMLKPGTTDQLVYHFRNGASPNALAQVLITGTTDRVYKRLLATAQYPGTPLRAATAGLTAGDGSWVDGEDYYMTVG